MTLALHRTVPAFLAAMVLAASLAACSGMGGGALSAGLSARMDKPGASLNRVEAIGLVNNYRTTRGAGALVEDAALDAMAQALVSQYANTGAAPTLPPGAVAMRVSAGYPTFAETFSGWRNSPDDAAVLAAPASTRAGIATAYNAASTYGVYWVLILAE